MINRYNKNTQIINNILEGRYVMASNKLDEILNLKKKLSEYRPFTQGELEYLYSDFLMEYTYNTNAIEGNTLSLEETSLVLEGITIAGKPLREHLEVIGHKDAFYYILDLVRDDISISEKTIKDIHSLILLDKPYDRGLYRGISVRVGTHTAPQPYRVPILMEQIIHEYNFDMSHLNVFEKAALFHLKFESIHPFIDGNGRTGRLLLNLDLMNNKYDPIDIKFSNRSRYYDCFSEYSLTGNYEAMLDLIYDCELFELTKKLNLLKERN